MKKGFTLAEVLVALAIIGVVAAITMPTFTANTANAKIGPALANAVTNFEQANEQLIAENEARSLLGLKGTWDVYKDGKYASKDGALFDSESGNGDVALYTAALSEYLKGAYDDQALTTKNGVHYNISLADKKTRKENNENINSDAPHKKFIGDLLIDINGKDAKPNKDGQDIFYFGLFADGSLRPKGGSSPWNNTDTETWREKCPAGEEPSKPEYCAGHIFENNLKVLYE